MNDSVKSHVFTVPVCRPIKHCPLQAMPVAGCLNRDMDDTMQMHNHKHLVLLWQNVSWAAKVRSSCVDTPICFQASTRIGIGELRDRRQRIRHTSHANGADDTVMLLKVSTSLECLSHSTLCQVTMQSDLCRISDYPVRCDP